MHLHAKVAQKAVSRYPSTMPQKQPLQITNKAVLGGHCCDVVRRKTFGSNTEAEKQVYCFFKKHVKHLGLQS